MARKKKSAKKSPLASLKQWAKEGRMKEKMEKGGMKKNMKKMPKKKMMM